MKGLDMAGETPLFELSVTVTDCVRRMRKEEVGDLNGLFRW